jgi:cell pole-organizing protein PopZ
MEEILASIRRIIADDQDGARPPAPVTARPQPGAKHDAGDVTALKPSRIGQQRPDVEEDESLRDEDGPAEIEDEADDRPDPPAAAEPAPPVLAPFPPASDPAPPPPRAFSRRPEPDALLSEAAQATAADAFQTLSATVRNSNPRTLEDVVREMLRPLLKAWLDDNLPPLVERLVRAEIERVARGGL